MGRQIFLKPLGNCSVEQQMRVLDIRNEPAIRAAMYASHEIALNEHLGYLDRLKGDASQHVLCILEDEQPIGIASFRNIDTANLRTDWAFFVTQSARGIGHALELAMIEHAFGALGMEKLNCEVLESNDKVVARHLEFGFQQEGFLKGEIQKDDGRVGVVQLGLLKSDWQALRGALDASLLEKADGVGVTFAESFEIEPTELDKITQIRARNNLNWMGLLRLAIELSPEEAKALITDIFAKDREISDLTKKLIQ